MTNKDEYEYFTESIGEQFMLMLWTSIGTLAVVGMILSVAM
jgi:hypothetical protein